MTWRIELRPAAAKQFAKLESSIQKRIAGAIDDLASDPRPPGCELISKGRLRNVLSDRDTTLWRVRVGHYRILYTIYDDQLLVLVVKVAHRGEVYRS